MVVLGSLSVQEAEWATALAEGPLLLILVALYALTPVVIVAHVIRRPGVDREAFFGGVAAYLLIGMTYAFAYVALGEFPGSPPFFGAQGDGTTAQCLFFSFTTLTTTGYGDLVPAGNPGQSLAISEAVLGQLFLVTALGKIVSNLPAQRPGRGGQRPLRSDAARARDAAPSASCRASAEVHAPVEDHLAGVAAAP